MAFEIPHGTYSPQFISIPDSPNWKSGPSVGLTIHNYQQVSMFFPIYS